MLTTLTGFSLLVFFYSGAYIFIKRNIRVNLAFIPLIINLALFLILFLASMVGLLQPAVWFIGLIGTGYFLVYICVKRQVIIAEILSMLTLWMGTIQTFFQTRIITKSFLIFIMSISAALTFLNISINIWVHSRLWILIAFILSSGLFYLIISLLSYHYVNILRENKSFRYFSTAAFVLSIFFYQTFLVENNYLVSRVDQIFIQPVDFEEYQSGEIILVELKEAKSQVKLEPVDEGIWKGAYHLKKPEGTESDILSDSLTFHFSTKGPTAYQFLFMETPTSGTAEIRINGKSHFYQLVNSEEGQSVFNIRSEYSFLDILVLGAQFIFSVTFFQALLIILFDLQKERKELFKSRYSEYLLFLILAIIMFILTRDMHYWQWDEFSHWGIFIKEISIKNALPKDNFCTVVPRYIPGITLFEYFFTKFLGYSEGHAYFAYLFFISTAVGSVIANNKKGKIANKLLYISVVAIMLFFLPLNFFSLYVDAALGLVFGAALVYLHTSQEDPVFYWVLLLFFCCLQLMKTWGLVFSVIIGGLYILENILVYGKTNQKGKNLLRQIAFMALALIASVILTELLWQLHIQQNEIEVLAVDGGSLFNFLRNLNFMDQNGLIQKWLRVTFQGRQETNLKGIFSIFNIGVLFLASGILTSYKDKSRIRFSLLIFFFFVINLMLVFLTYIVYFPEDEGARLASYERYVSEFLIGWFLFLVFLISTCRERNTCNKSISKIAHYSLLGLVFLAIPFIYKMVDLPTKQLIGRRESNNLLLEKYKGTILDGEYHRIFHIAQNVNGLSHHILRYDLCPNTAQPEKWSFGYPYPDKLSETETTYYSPEEIENIIFSSYDFVLISHPDEQLWDLYGHIFPEAGTDDEFLYKVENNQLIIVK